jgi:hypothetical protein
MLYYEAKDGEVLNAESGIRHNVPRIYEVAWYPEGVDKYLGNCITIYQIFVKGNLPKAKAKPQRIFAVRCSNKSGHYGL